MTRRRTKQVLTLDPLSDDSDGFEAGSRPTSGSQAAALGFGQPPAARHSAERCDYLHPWSLPALTLSSSYLAPARRAASGPAAGFTNPDALIKKQEAVRGLLPFPGFRTTLTLAPYYQAIKQYQLDLEERNSDIKALRMRIQQLENSKASQRADRGDSAAGSTEGSSASDTAKTLGRKFALLNEPFIKLEWLKGPVPHASILDPDRYSSPEAATECIKAEVFDLVPVALHPYLERETNFGKLVSCTARLRLRTLPF